MYFDFNEKVNRIPSHRILAINRAEKENAIKLKIQKPEENIIDFIERDVIKDKTVIMQIFLKILLKIVLKD